MLSSLAHIADLGIPQKEKAEDDGAGVGSGQSEGDHTSTDAALMVEISSSRDQSQVEDANEPLIGITSDNKTIRQKKVDISEVSTPKSVCSIIVLDSYHGDIVAGYDDGSIRRWNLSPSATEPDLVRVNMYSVMILTLTFIRNTFIV